KKAAIVVIAILVIVGLSLPAIAQYVSVELLRKAGYPNAAIGGASLEKGGIALKNIDFGDGITVEKVDVSVNLGELMGGRTSLALAAGGQQARVNVRLPWGNLPITGAGTLLPSGGGWQVDSDVTGDAPFIKLAGHLSGETNGKLHLDL